MTEDSNVEGEPADLARDIALAKLKQRLFNRDVAVKIGRYQLLEVVGQGGMGVVWGAWDPELDRRVAIKLVKASLPASRERMLIEGQALARLSHPNVIAIYDVGTLDEQVYLVMEWVRGENLRRYGRVPRTVHELVAVYRQVGEGLAAAHAAGLVHRDFKPENAIRGEDGRVRVLDFGLALDELGGDAVPGGTPRYMAPEQAAGQVSAACDQYAFCVALREALVRRNAVDRDADVPHWLAAIAARGAQSDPDARYPSMRDLLEALARDPARIARRRAIAAAGVLTIAAAFVLGRSATGGSELDRCAGAEGELAAAWSSDARSAVVRHLGAIGPDAAQQAGGVVRDLDGYATAWIDTHRQACMAHQRSELTVVLYEHRLACLSQSRAALGAMAELLATTMPERLDAALAAARSLPDARRCDADDAGRIAPPPAAMAPLVDDVGREIARARVLTVAADPRAEAAARAAVDHAEITRYAAVIARALLVRGRVEADLHAPGASGSLTRAVQLAIEAGDDATATEAFARLISVAADTGDEVDGLSLVEPMATRAGPSVRALLHNNLAMRRLTRADYAGARALLLRARSELPPDPVHVDIELLCIAQNLALIAATPDEREREYRTVADAFERALGPTHAKTLEARVLEALATDHPARARARLEQVCASYRGIPHLGAARAWCEVELGWLADESGDVGGAIAAMQRALLDRDRLDPDLAEIIAAYVTALAPEQSVAGAQRALDRLRALTRVLATAPDAWRLFVAADASTAAARAAERLGDPIVAAASWSAALDLLERANLPLYRRRLARVRAAVARHRARSDPEGARRLAELARGWYVAAGGYDDALRALPFHSSISGSP